MGQTHNPIVTGDHPDPTIIRVGATYWTTSTSGDWAPQFPLYRSQDLKHWTPTGAVFPVTPEWAAGDFWAPELVYDRGQTLLYYVARKQGGPLCVAAATAPGPAGPYTDRGPILCEHDGSIDPSFVRDEQGQPYLIWKEDGNSEGKPTPIWAQPLAADLLHLTGTRTQIIANEPTSWEGGVVEAPFILRHGGTFYLFYAGNACCGTACHYAEGVARATNLLGPWTKDPANPIIRPNAAWKCPGHGTAVETRSGADFFLYHAYPATGTIYLGRESVLDRITWTPDGWPELNHGNGPSGGSAAPAGKSAFRDDFRGKVLDPEWKWPVHRAPAIQLGALGLTLAPAANGEQRFIGRSLPSTNYTASVAVRAGNETHGGLAIVGDSRNQILLSVSGSALELSQMTDGKLQVLWQKPLGPSPHTVWLRVASPGPTQAHFSYNLTGKDWIDAGETVDLTRLPPWDQGLRIGLVADGPAGSHVTFSHFRL